MSNENEKAAVAAADNSGRTVGLIAIAAAPGAALISPTMFSLLTFFLALMGLTVSSPEQRKFSFIAIVLAGTFAFIGHYFNTPII
jgi:hypothetical protein